jgi:hypothetical protein
LHGVSEHASRVLAVGADVGAAVVAVGMGVGGSDVEQPSPVNPGGHGVHTNEPAVLTQVPLPLHGWLRTLHSFTSSSHTVPVHPSVQLHVKPIDTVAAHPLR